MAQKVLEKDLEKRFKDLLDRHGIFNIKGNPQNLKGYPDRLVFGDKIYFVEIKVGKDGGSYYQQTKTQKFWERKIRESQGNYVLLTGKEEIEAFVEKIKALM